MENYFRLDPFGNSAEPSGSGYYFARQYEAAAEAARRAIRSHPDFPATSATGRVGESGHPSGGNQTEEFDPDHATLGGASEIEGSICLILTTSMLCYRKIVDGSQ